MVKFEQTFRDAVANAERDVMIEQIRATPEMTIAELGKLAIGDLGAVLKQVTIGDILGVGTPAPVKAPARAAGGRGRGGRGKKAAAAPAAAAPAAAAGQAAPAPKTRRGAGSSKPKGVNTRTQDGRDAYDKAMLDVLKGSSKQMAAPELGTAVGGTPLQVRTSLARLIQAGKVSWTGKARGTRYKAL